MKTKYFLITAALLGGLSHAADITPRQLNGISYVSGGVGLEEQAAMHALKQDYNLTMTFAVRGSGDFESGVQVLIEQNGKEVLNVADSGPLFFAQLSPGTYKVSVSVHGKTQAKSAYLSTNGKQELTFYWEPSSTQ